MSIDRSLERQMNHDHSRHDVPPSGFWRSRYAIGLLVMGAVAAYFLLTEHRAHFFAALPFLLLLTCPLMHMFMHGGHGGGHGDHGDGKPGANSPEPTPATKTGEQP
jgi:Protein of unknown function (DUF2933)